MKNVFSLVKNVELLGNSHLQRSFLWLVDSECLHNALLHFSKTFDSKYAFGAFSQFW